jgi:hypothetical protein
MSHRTVSATESDRYAGRHILFGWIFAAMAIPMPVFAYLRDGSMMGGSGSWLALLAAFAPHLVLVGLEGMFITLTFWNFRRANYYQTRHLDGLDHKRRPTPTIKQQSNGCSRMAGFEVLTEGSSGQ